MKLTGLILCSLFLVNRGYAQKITFEVPTKINARVGQELSVKLNIVGVRKYSVVAEGNPASSFLRNNRFTWTPKIDEARDYLVKFILLDSLGVRINEADIALTIDSQLTPPNLVFDRPLPDTIKVTENGLFFHFNFNKKWRWIQTLKTVAAYFLFNENVDLRSFDSCRVNRLGDQILFGWTPSNQEALKGYAKFRITLVSTNNSVKSTVLNFKIKNINQSPKFLNEIPDTVFIPSSGDLTLDFSAADPDHDNLKYDFSPKSRGSSMSFLYFHVSIMEHVTNL